MFIAKNFGCEFVNVKIDWNETDELLKSFVTNGEA